MIVRCRKLVKRHGAGRIYFLHSPYTNSSTAPKGHHKIDRRQEHASHSEGRNTGAGYGISHILLSVNETDDVRTSVLVSRLPDQVIDTIAIDDIEPV
jgi:hypothetical protein